MDVLLLAWSGVDPGVDDDGDGVLLLLVLVLVVGFQFQAELFGCAAAKDHSFSLA